MSTDERKTGEWRRFLPRRPALVLAVTFVAMLVLLNGCVAGTAPRPLVDIQSEVSTAVAATMSAENSSAVAQSGLTADQVATEVAVQVAAQVATQMAAQAAVASPVSAASAATPTPVPVIVQAASPTPVPAVQAASPTPVPAAAAAPAPKIWAEANTNCRAGPDTVYKVVGYLMEGATSFVYGRDAANEWWYIQNPTSSKTNANCWVWTGSTRVENGAADMPVVASPSLNPSTKASNNYWNTCGYGGCGYYAGYPYTYCKNNCASCNCTKGKRVCRTHKVLVCTKPNKCTWKTVRDCDYYPNCSACYSSCTACFPYVNWPPAPSCNNKFPDDWWDDNKVVWKQ